MITKATRRAFLKWAMQLPVAGAAVPFALNLASIKAAAAQNATDYRALVCVFLIGGNDHNNTLIPYDEHNYLAYRRFRPTLARSLDDILPLTPSISFTGNNAGRIFALPKELSALKSWWDEGKLAVLANVGPLIVPTTQKQYNNGSVPLPPRLFSHSDQQIVWQAHRAEDSRYGWGGRIADLLLSHNANSAFSTSSVAGNSLFLAGQNTSSYQLNNQNATISAIKGELFGSAVASGVLKTLITQGGAHVLAHDLATIATRSIDAGQLLSSALVKITDLPLNSELSANSLALQLRTVARVIAAHEMLGVKRQVFFVALNGFDTHDDQIHRQSLLHSKLAQALDFFQITLQTFGLEQQVTTFTASDFGRTLLNNDDGTDHGWGGHHFILGGAVKGQQFYGQFPAISTQHNYAIDAGRLIPTTAVEQYAATLARWFGVSEQDMELILPNIGHFDGADLGFMQR